MHGSCKRIPYVRVITHLEVLLPAPCRTSKGHITKADLAEGLRINSPSAFEALHSSGSLEAELAEEFEALDANGDGVVTLDEFKAALSLPSPLKPTTVQAH